MYFQKIILCILCWCLCQSIASQISAIDSLEQVLASGRLNDLEKCKLLLEISREYRYEDDAKSITYALEALDLSQNRGFKEEESSSYIALANGYHLIDTAKHRAYAMEAIKVAQSAGLEEREATAYLALANYYTDVNHFYPAHVYYKKAEKLFAKTNDGEALRTVYNNLMFLFFFIDDDENSIYYGNKLLELIAGQDTMSGEAFNVQFMLGMMRFRDNRGQDALDFYLDMYQKAKLLNIDDSRTGCIALCCGDKYIQQNRPREALPYLYEARKYAESIQQPDPNIYTSLSETYAMLHQTDSAEYYLKKAQETPFTEDMSNQNILRSQSIIESVKGNNRSALKTYRQYHHLSDSIAKAKKTAEIARMRNWHELEQKDNENELLQQEGRKQHQLILILAGTLVMILALLALSVYFYRQSIAKNRELKELHTVKDKLFSVIAHDLRSPMGSLMSMLKLADNNMLDTGTQAQLLRDISMRVDDTHGLLDNLLRWSKSQMQGIAPAPAYFDAQNEIQTLMISLQNIASAKQITLNNRIGNQEVYADRDMFAVVVRNLITNAIKYTSDGGNVTLNSELSGNMLVISVKDAGTGMTQEIQNSLFKLTETKSQRGTRNESGAGLGLVLCADFVKANGGSIWFASTQGEGSTFYFNIPVKGN